LAVLAPLLVGLPPAITAAAPTIGAIVVESFNCDTGFLEAYVPVSDLERVPDPADEADFPFRWSYEAHYENGSSYNPPEPFYAFNPPSSQSPYSGNLPLTVFVPTNDPGGGVGPDPITSIDLAASVGHTVGEPTFSTSTTYSVVCGDDLVTQLIAVLKAILQSILGG
jgi:hypothetical protein